MRLDAADVDGVQPEFIGAAEQAGTLAELDEHDGQQNQADQYK